MSDELKLLGTTDAREWATEFCKLNRASDLGFMIGWFANAIETGRSFGRLEVEDALRAENERLQKVAGLADALAHEFERAVASKEQTGGMQVSNHSDFVSAAQLPSVLGKMRWWAREIRAVLAALDKEDK